MKKIIFFGFLILSVAGMKAQSDKYLKAMEPNVAALDTSHSPEAFAELSNTFQRIADAEKTQWLPYYYAALTSVMGGITMQGATVDKTDPLADKAESLLEKAVALQKANTGASAAKENSEIFIVRKMISTLRMMADPMNRYQTQVPLGKEALEKAKSLNPENPRVPMLEGQDLYYTPEEYGGSKEKAKVLFEESMKKFEASKPSSPIDPHWGLNQVKYFYSLYK